MIFIISNEFENHIFRYLNFFLQAYIQIIKSEAKVIKTLVIEYQYIDKLHTKLQSESSHTDSNNY